MRILHVGKYYPPFAGGIENFHHDLVGAQIETGLAVASLVHHHHSGHSTRREDIDGTSVCRVRIAGTMLYTPIALGFRRQLVRAIKRWNPDVLHFHVPNPSALWALTAKAARSVPWVVQWQSDIVPSKHDRRLRCAYSWYRPLESRFLRSSAAIIAASPTYLQSSLPLAPFLDHCHVVPLGISKTRVAEPTSADIAETAALWRNGPMRLLMVGRLTYYKGHKVLLRALERVSDVQVCLVGSGELEQAVREEIHALGLAERVRMLGHAPQPQVQALLATCDCLCLPSLERTEAFGLVLVEAMRYGKPCIATSIPGSGVGWVVRDGVTGLLAPPGDADALAQAIRRLVDDAPLREQFGRNAAADFAQRFDIFAVERQIRDIYEQVLR